MEYDGKDIKAIRIPTEKIISVTDQIFDRWKWFERRVDNIPLGVEFAVEACLESACFSSREFKKKAEELKKAGTYDTTAHYVTPMTIKFSDLYHELEDNTKEFSPTHEATKEVIEKVVRPIGEKVIAEVCVDNILVPEVTWVFAY